MKTNTRISIVLASLLAAGAVNAAPITGSINIVSFSDPMFAFNTTTNTVTFGPANNAIVSATLGSSYAGLVFPGAPVHYNSFNYGALPGSVAVAPLWITTAGTLASFDLTTITSIGEPAGFLNLAGTGTAKLAGFTETRGDWTFTATNNRGEFSFTSINTPRVPDGGATLALLGVSVLGLGGMRRFLPSLKK